ncbi:MAG: hypothetical protein DCC67_17440 [Planctomycetota bacterium]|nr:MAG: hypothetical protein DCC67_17440 [Planctomycetota bacterium]
MSSSRLSARPQRILIVRLSALGDVIHGLPVACALREALPTAVIGWVVEGRPVEMLAGHPAIDHLIRLPRKWWKSIPAVLDLRRRLRELRFDVTIDLQCLTKSSVAAWLSGARRRIGKAGSDGRELSKLFNNELVAVRGKHVIDHYLELLRPLGVDAPTVRFDLPEPAADARTAEQLLRRRQLAPGGFAILNPGAGWASKIWPPDRYGEVARRLKAQFDLPSLAVWGVPGELPLAEAIVAASRGAAAPDDQPPWPQPRRVVRRLRRQQHPLAGPLRGRLRPAASSGRRFRDARYQRGDGLRGLLRTARRRPPAKRLDRALRTPAGDVSF